MPITVESPSIEGVLVQLRSGNDQDLPRLQDIFSEPAVVRWWFPQDASKVSSRVKRRDRFGWVIEQDRTVVGWIQAGEEEDQEYRSAWIDIAVATAAHGTGVARDALRTVMRFLIDTRDHHRLTIDPDVDNARAVRAYEKVGFRPVGVMRHYCRRPDGSFGDGLLMEHVVGVDPPPWSLQVRAAT